MGSATLRNQQPQPASEIVQETLRACELARAGARAAGQGLAGGAPELLDSVRETEKQLDAIDRELDERITNVITQVTEPDDARELLACMKLIIGLERIGDLLVGFAERAGAVGARLDPQDVNDLTTMAGIVERMLGEVQSAFAGRDLRRAIGVLRADAELDRLRNLMFVRHIENPEGAPRQESFHVIFMAQALERAGDHAKNLAEEICHLISGRTVRHVLRSFDRPFEQMFLDWMKQKSR
jgi:phosphate transport system protein